MFRARARNGGGGGVARPSAERAPLDTARPKASPVRPRIHPNKTEKWLFAGRRILPGGIASHRIAVLSTRSDRSVSSVVVVVVERGERASERRWRRRPSGARARSPLRDGGAVRAEPPSTAVRCGSSRVPEDPKLCARLTGVSTTTSPLLLPLPVRVPRLLLPPPPPPLRARRRHPIDP